MKLTTKRRHAGGGAPNRNRRGTGMTTFGKTAEYPTTDAVTLLRAEHAVATLLADASDLTSSYPEVLRAIAEALGWEVAAAWEKEPDDPLSLRRVALWPSPSIPYSRVEPLAASTTMPIGHGLPGRVWRSGTPAWIVDVTVDPDFPRAEAAKEAGLHSAFCFPVVSGEELAGVMEFFTPEPRMPDDHLLETMASLGRHIGQFIDRADAHASMHDSEARMRAILEAALDCVVTMDEQGCVVEFNPAAERTFGYAREDVIGLEMAELIVPPRLRDMHRQGLRRYLATGAPVVLNRRIEITGMRADGSEFPVELAITRIPVPGRPMFTGYLRDITERKRAEQELRASRARIVQATDAERRRLERDLHDGAQQRLVALLLSLRVIRSRVEGEPADAARLLDEAIEELAGATSELRELARGIHPAILTDRGLAAALKALAARAPLPVEVDSDVTDRLPPPVEAALYFVAAEGLTNVARYANATRAEVRVRRGESSVTVDVTDDGIGGGRPLDGPRLRGGYR